jgi:hypothetical protein
MKTRIFCACLVLLIVAVACTSQSSAVKPFEKDSKTQMTAGHYSLMYLPNVSHLEPMIPMTGKNGLSADQNKRCELRTVGVHSRFGRSLMFRCIKTDQ